MSAMDIEAVRRLREEYEEALDDAERRRARYHHAIRKIYMSGVPLREIADGLGVSYQRIHQIVGAEPPSRRKRRGMSMSIMLAILAMGAFGMVRAMADSRIVTLDSLPSGVSAVRVDGELIFLRRAGSTVVAFLGRSPHLGEEIRWCPREHVFVSPAHGELFDSEGRFLSGPAVRDLDRVPVRVTSGQLVTDPRRAVRAAGRTSGAAPAWVLAIHHEWIQGSLGGFCDRAMG